MLRAIIDFPQSAEDGAAVSRLAFHDPAEIITAVTCDEVIPALERAGMLADAGAWVVGFVAYEAAPAFDRAMRVHDGGRMPLVQFGVFAAPADARSVASVSAINAGSIEWSQTADEQELRDAIDRIQEAIRDGETYQVNYTTRLRASYAGDTLQLYESLRLSQGSGWHAFIESDDFALVSASPELFFERRGGSIVTRPMKGTMRRGRWLAEDEQCRKALLDSAKDRAENLMIVDLLRNDLGRAARTASVHVPQLFTAERYHTVWQLTSCVEAQLRDDVGIVDIFRALFPCGSVTGAPKINTMRWIRDLERSPREVYCGALGVIRPGGDCTFNVPIRTVIVDRNTGRAEYGVGSGVTIDSQVDAELDEFRAKALILHAPAREFELLETMRLEDGVILRLDRHMKRLSNSATYFGYSLDLANVRQRLAEISEPHAGAGARKASSAIAPKASQALRVRLLVSANGTISIEASEPAPPRFDTRDDCRKHHSVQRVVIAPAAVASSDPFLCNKTTRRDVYDAAKAHAPDAFDVLLWNEREELTEFTTGNVVLELDGSLVTPAQSCGLLGGTFRQELVESGVVRVAVIPVTAVRDCTRMWLVNSLREWVEVIVQ